MKIVNVIGGLGNQMFQCAFAIALQKAFPDEEVKIDIHTFKGYGLHNGFEINRIFQLPFRFSAAKDLAKVAYPWIHYRLWQIGTRILPCRKGMVRDCNFETSFSMDSVKDKSYFDGYWQAPQFFEDYRSEIVKTFSFPKIDDENNLRAIEFINQCQTAFIHVRRGDYVNHPVYGGICTLDYYKKGIQLLTSTYGFSQFLIFSNDIEWCRRELIALLPDAQVMFVNWNKGENSYRDMQLMTKCQGALIANSSFSWWGAWLSDARIIICPSRWFNNSSKLQNIIPPEWQKVI